MSLLLKALQNAAKDREAGAAGSQAQASPASTDAASEGASGLALEPMDHKPGDDASPRTERSARPGAAPDTSSARASDGPGAASRAQARSVLRAGAAKEAGTDGGGPLGALARRPLVAFSTAAGLFAIGYGVYLYLQITKPGMFLAQPSPVARPAPPPPPPPAAVPAAPPAPGPVAAAPVEVPPPSATPAAPPVGAVQPPAQPAVGGIAAAPGAPATPVARAPAAPAPAAPAAPGLASPPAVSATPTAPAAGAPVAVAPTPPREPAPAAKAGATNRPAPARAAAPAPVPAQPAPAVAVVPSDLALAYQALQSGRFDEAERLYRQVLAGDARSIDAMLGLASVHIHRNRADAATQLYMRVLEVDPRNSHAQAGLLGLGGRADPAAAEARLKQLIAREPSAYLYFTLGNLYAEQNQWAAAQGAYFQAFNLAPDNPDYAFNLAVGLEHLSQPRLALDYYRRAVTLAQSRGNAQFALPPVQGRIRSLEAALSERP